MTMDFSRLKTPSKHGDTLVEPPAAQLARLATANHAQLDGMDFRVLDASGTEVRRAVRRALGLRDDTLVIVAGHQPGFIHPGVWAKHVVVHRLADAVSGAALNLVVDSDAPQDTTLHIPTAQSGRLAVAALPCVAVQPGFALETARRIPGARLAQLERTLRLMLGERFERSMMPVYLKRLGDDDSGYDWVDQSVSARRAVENQVGVEVNDVRVGRVWTCPLLVETIIRAGKFAAAYNRALADYRRRYRVGGARRPIADLCIEHGRVEVPAWVYRRNEPRHRLLIPS